MDLVRQINELTRTHPTISGFDIKTEGKIVGAVMAMGANLNTYGKVINAAAAQGWLMALRMNATVTYEELDGAFCHWLAKERDFPAPADVLRWIEDNRQDEARQEAIRDGIRRENEADEARRRAKNLKTYGVEDPSQEQVRAKMIERFGSDPMEILMGEKPRPQWIEPSEADKEYWAGVREAQKKQAMDFGG